MLGPDIHRTPSLQGVPLPKLWMMSMSAGLCSRCQPWRPACSLCKGAHPWPSLLCLERLQAFKQAPALQKGSSRAAPAGGQLGMGVCGLERLHPVCSLGDPHRLHRPAVFATSRCEETRHCRGVLAAPAKVTSWCSFPLPATVLCTVPDRGQGHTAGSQSRHLQARNAQGLLLLHG